MCFWACALPLTLGDAPPGLLVLGPASPWRVLALVELAAVPEVARVEDGGEDAEARRAGQGPVAAAAGRAGAVAPLVVEETQGLRGRVRPAATIFQARWSRRKRSPSASIVRSYRLFL